MRPLLTVGVFSSSSAGVPNVEQGALPQWQHDRAISPYRNTMVCCRREPTLQPPNALIPRARVRCLDGDAPCLPPGVVAGGNNAYSVHTR